MKPDLITIITHSGTGEHVMRISTVMPAYNEEQNIEQTVRYCFEVLRSITPDSEVVVCNDGSVDRTGTILASLQAEYKDLKVVTNNPNQGYGAAMANAIAASTGDIVVSIDSDGQFDIADLHHMLPLFTGNLDVLSGYRTSKKDTFIKVFADRTLNRMIRLMFGVKYKDTNCALKLYRGSMIRSLNLEARGFQLPTEIMLKAHALNYTIAETPVTHRERKGGASSLAPWKTATQMLRFLLYVRRKITLYRKGVLRSL
jgi:glycosyltransferase involved in cell wall biosynthesis